MLYRQVFCHLLVACVFASGRVFAAPLAALTPEPRQTEYQWMSNATWYRHHADDVELSHGQDATAIQLLFIGDSITESWDWDDDYRAEFDRYFGKYRTANLGIGGDMTQNLLWRLQHGAVGKFSPRAIVLMIGVNNLNLGQQTPEQAALGVGAVIQQLLNDFPAARILCLGILPFGEDADHEGRNQVKKANKAITQLQSERVDIYDFGAMFVDQQGRIPKELMYDFLHPTPKGMGLLGAKLQPLIDQLLK